VLVRAEWQAGRLGELIGLTIEAGFEMGGLAARRVWDELLAWIASPRFWRRRPTPSSPPRRRSTGPWAT